MALFLDGPISSIEDLRGQDTQLLEVARIEDIDVTRKLAEAQEEIAIDLAVMLEGACRPARIANVVVTAPLRLWHQFRTLDMVYSDAFNSQLNDRYSGKRDAYHEATAQSRERMIQSGVGMVADPIAQAASPTLQTVVGGLADGTYYVAVAWTNGGGETGASSVPTTIAVSGRSFDVLHGEAPANAKGWHVYVGSGPGTMLRQNTGVISLGTVWRQPDAVAPGGRAGRGQVPGFVVAVPRVIWRG